MKVQSQRVTISISTADRLLIEDEHKRLEQFLNDLCDTCSEFPSQSDCNNCSREKVAACKGRLPSFFYDFHDLAAEHCEHEEQIMSSFPELENLADYLQSHQEDHLKIIQEIKHQIEDSSLLSRQGNAALAIRNFYGFIKDRFSEHARSFDNIILNA